MAKQQGCIARFVKLFALSTCTLIGCVLLINMMIGRAPQTAVQENTTPVQAQPVVVQQATPEPSVSASMPAEHVVAAPTDKEPSIEELVAAANAARPIIPGLVAVDVHGNLTNRGFTLKSRMGQTQCEWLCGRELPWGRMDVDCFGPNPNALWSITAIVGGPEIWAAEEAKGAKELFPFIATLPYEGAEPEAASKWVAENVGKNAKRVFGPCQFELSKANAHVLQITAVAK